MRVLIGDLSVSLNEKAIHKMKKETWLKDVLKTHAKFGLDKEKADKIFSDAYDSVKKEKK